MDHVVVLYMLKKNKRKNVIIIIIQGFILRIVFKFAIQNGTKVPIHRHFCLFEICSFFYFRPKAALKLEEDQKRICSHISFLQKLLLNFTAFPCSPTDRDIWATLNNVFQVIKGSVLCTSFISYLTWLAVSFAVQTKTSQDDEQHNNCHTYHRQKCSGIHTWEINQDFNYLFV